ncbi:hypothetical protein MLD52_22225, partial [Puniceicoccaceae bacterium K14]|nr:hypothetical protein [Puniceicoccaceae bacterium K14]
RLRVAGPRCRRESSGSSAPVADHVSTYASKLALLGQVLSLYGGSALRLLGSDGPVAKASPSQAHDSPPTDRNNQRRRCRSRNEKKLRFQESQRLTALDIAS